MAVKTLPNNLKLLSSTVVDIPGLEKPLGSYSYSRARISRHVKFRLISQRIYITVNQFLKMHRKLSEVFFLLIF